MSDYQKADDLTSGFQADYVIADKGYDSNAFVQSVTDSGAQAVIPVVVKELRSYDKEVYKERNLVERLFQKLNIIEELLRDMNA